MIGLFRFAPCVLASPFRSKLRLEAENAALRDQLIVLRRRPRGRVRLTYLDRWFFIQLFRWFPAILKVLTIIRPETLLRWHRAKFHGQTVGATRPGMANLLRNHAPDVAAMDLFVIPTIGFKLLYAFVIVRLS